MNSARNLERRLLEELGIPIPLSTSAPTEFGSAKRDTILRLRRLVAQLERDASRIGATPQGYPKHVTLVIRVIGALLPWYTRSLVQFGNTTVHTARATLDVLDELLACQPNHEFSEPATAPQALPRTVQDSHSRRL